MEGSKEAERQPLLPKLRSPHSDSALQASYDGSRETTDAGSGTTTDAEPGTTTLGETMTRQQIRNMFVANVLMFLLSAGGGFCMLTLRQYVYVRIAENMLGPEYAKNHHTHPCVQNTSSEQHHRQSEVQSAAARLLQYCSLSYAVPALIVNVFLGAYSDHLGRRFLFTVTVFSYVFLYTVPAVVCYFKLSLYWIFLGFALHGCFGSYIAFLLALFVYNADNTPRNSTRTFGLVLLGCVGAFANVCGEMGGGYFIEDLGYFYPMLTGSVLAITACLVVIFFLKETRPAQPGQSVPSPRQAVRETFGFYFIKSEAAESDVPQSAERRPSPQSGEGLRSEDRRGLESADTENRHGPLSRDERELQSTETLAQIELGSDGTVDEGHPGPLQIEDRRGEYILGVTVFFFIMLPLVGSGGVAVLYVIKEPFCWSPKHIGNYNTAKGLLQHGLSLVAQKLLTQVVKLKDEWIGVMGMVSAASGYLILSFACCEWMLYTAAAAGILSSLGPFALRSLMSQRAPAGKQGSLFAGQAVVETICSMTGNSLFDSVYAATVEEFRGAAYLTMAAVVGLGAICMGFYIRLIRRRATARQRYTPLNIQGLDGQGKEPVHQRT